METGEDYIDSVRGRGSGNITSSFREVTHAAAGSLFTALWGVGVATIASRAAKGMFYAGNKVAGVVLGV